jgi:hypothetical protein
MTTRTNIKVAMIVGLAIIISLPVIVRGQPAQIPSKKQAYSLSSGLHDGEKTIGAETRVAFSEVVQVPGCSMDKVVFRQLRAWRCQPYQDNLA